MSPPKITPAASIFLTTATANWRTMADVVKACKGKPVKITGTTLDLKGCQLVGTKLPKPKNEDDESSVPLRISIPGFTLKNGSTRRIPGGILFRGKGVTLSRIICLDVGEDAISNVMDDSEEATVDHCEAWGASDKSYQFNDARGLTFTNNLTVGGRTAVRFQKKATAHKGIRTRKVSGNRFVDVDTAWHLSGGVKVAATASHYDNVNTRWVTNPGCSYTDKP